MTIFKYCFSNKRIISIDACLLISRILNMGLLFYKHGFEKIFGFQEMLVTFPDPLNIGKLSSFTFALISDSLCAVLIAIGLFSRFAALLILLNLFVAFFVFHHGIINDHGETIMLYVINVVFLFLIGPGKFSLDAKLR